MTYDSVDHFCMHLTYSTQLQKYSKHFLGLNDAIDTSSALQGFIPRQINSISDIFSLQYISILPLHSIHFEESDWLRSQCVIIDPFTLK